jgi:death-on-curing protein
MIELAKMAWSPVLDLLGKEVRIEELDQKRYDMSTKTPFSGGLKVRDRRNEAQKGQHWRWLSARDVVEIHDEMVRTFGGEMGIMDLGRIQSALDLAFESPIRGHDPFPTLIDKAASVMHSILLYHPFVDGQKRTGISTAFILLGVNGYYMWSREPLDEVHFAVHVAKGEFEVPDIAKWISARVAPTSILDNPTLVEELLPYAERRSRRCSVCHKSIKLDKFRVRCKWCGSTYEVQLNAALIQRGRRGLRFFVQPGMKLIPSARIAQRTLI